MGKAPLAIELRVPGRSDHGIAPLVDEFSARGRLLQLKAHDDTLSLLKSVEKSLAEHKDASALRKKAAAEEKRKAEAAGNTQKRKELESATAEMEKARSAAVAMEAAERAVAEEAHCSR